MQYTETTLKNGMRVVTVPMKDTNSLTLLVLFGTGSKYETKEQSGVSHFLEHLFFKGTTSRPKAGQINQALDDIGAEHNAFTSKEMTGYWVKAASHHFGTALDIVSDILLEPLFKEEEIKKERGVIFQEMSMYRDDPRRRIHDVFEELLYGDQPAGWDIIGTRKTLSNLTRKDILAYRKNHYRGSNAVVIIAGNIDEHKAIADITKAFRPLTNGTAGAKQKVHERQLKPAVRIEYKDTDQTHVVLGVRAYDMYDEKRYAMRMLAIILGGKTSSRLWHDIREKRGLAYTVSASSEHATDTGYLSVYAGVPHEKTKEVIQRIVAALRVMRVKGVSRQELARAKDFYRGQFAIGLESSDELASFFGEQELFYNNIKTPDEVLERIDRVREADILAVAREMFVPQGLNVAIIGPHREPLEFEALLKV